MQRNPLKSCLIKDKLNIIINNQPTVKESCPDGNGTLNSRVELHC